jgi:hypothetical protein
MVYLAIPGTRQCICNAEIGPTIVGYVSVDMIQMIGRLLLGHHFPDDTMRHSQASIDPDLSVSPTLKSSGFFAGMLYIEDHIGL